LTVGLNELPLINKLASGILKPVLSPRTSEETTISSIRMVKFQIKKYE
jgi:hypothetical protein